MNKNELGSVPFLAEKLLSLALPARLRDPILGDLEEEYLLDIVPSLGRMKGKSWYYRQVAKTISIFLWKERGGIMAFLWSVLFFIFMTIFAFVIDFDTFAFNPKALLYIFDTASFLIVVPPALFFGIAVTSVEAAKLSLKLSFSEQIDVDRKAVKEACNFLKTFGYLSVIIGWLGTLAGYIIISQGAQDDWTLSLMGPANAVALITIFYGLFFKAIAYVAEMKIRNKYLED